MKRESNYLLLYAILIFLFFADGILADKLIAVGDGIVYNYPLHAFYAKYIKQFYFPLWLPYEYMGMPFLGLGQAGVLYPVNIVVHFLFSDSIAYNANLLLHYIIACFFTYLYARLIGCKELPSFVAGAVFSLSGFMIGHHGNLQMQNAASLFPVILYLYEKMKSLLKPGYALGAGIVITLQILSGHFQIAVYTLFFLAVYIIFNYFQVERTQKIRFLILSISSLIIGLILALPQLISTKELTSFSWRVGASYSWFTEYSLSAFHFVTFIFPYFLGGGGGIYVWGPWIFSDFIAYVGIVPLMIGMITLLKEWKVNPTVKFWGIISFIAVFLALGRNNPLYKIMFYIPVYNLFRVPTRNLLFLEFAFSVLCAVGLNIMLSGNSKSKIYANLLLKLVILVLIGSLLLAGGVMAGMKYFGDKIEQLIIVRYSLIESYTFDKPALFFPIVLLLASLLIAYVYNKSGKKIAMYSLIALLFFDLYSFSYLLLARKAWITRDSIENICQTPPYSYFKDKTDARVALVEQSGILNHMQCAISTIHGYDPLVLNKFIILMNLKYQYGFIYNWDELIENNLILSIFNVKYIMTSQPDKVINNSAYQKIAQVGKQSVFLNKNYVSRISSVIKLRPAHDIYEIRKLFTGKMINPQQEAVVYQYDFKELQGYNFVQGIGKILHYEPNKITLTVTTRGTSFFILSESFYPHWKAYLDDKETKIYEVNGIVRGVLVPQGTHSLIFYYK